MSSKFLELHEYPFRLVKEGRRLRYIIEIVNFLCSHNIEKIKRSDIADYLLMIGERDSRLMYKYGLTGMIGSKATAMGYINNAKALYLIENGKELRLTEFGQALQVISKKRKHSKMKILNYFELTRAERAFFLSILFLRVSASLSLSN